MPKALGASAMETGFILQDEAIDERQRVQDDFDELLDRFQSQPSDEEARDSLVSIMDQAFDEGDVDFLMRNAMMMAAMACTDPHMEELAEKSSSLLDRLNDPNASQSGHGVGHEARGSAKKKKADKKKQLGRSWAQLLIDRMTKSAA